MKDRVITSQLATLPFLVGGALLALGHAWAIALLVPGVLTAFAAGLINAWVLLVEILR